MKAIYIKITMAFSMALVACSSERLEEHPPHLITGETLFSNLAGFEAGLNGLYARVREEKAGRNANDMIGSMFIDGTDNLVSNHRDIGFNFISQFWQDINNPNHVSIEYNFSWLYSIVNAANTIISRANHSAVDWEGVGSAPEDNRNRVVAEARAIRAWAYRHLSFCWGDVPLNLEESIGSTIKTDWERAPVADVRQQILNDFLAAEPHIDFEPKMNGRITKGAVQHYLAEMYLTIHKPDSALYWANKVINTPQYRLVTERYGVRANRAGVPFMDMFYEGNENRVQGNTEALWVFQFALETVGGGASIVRRHHASRISDWVVGGVKPIRDTYERGGRGRSRMSLTKWALESYEPQDHRNSEFAIRRFYVLNDEVANAPYPADIPPDGYHFGDTIWLDWTDDITSTNLARMNWPFSRKVEGTNPNNVAAEEQWNDHVYLRLADTYLLKAEAQFLLGDLTGAAETINVVRRRANASEISSDQVDIDFILDERSRELVLEEHRRFTLLRTGKWFERTRKYNKNGGQHITLRDTLFPIPQSVIDVNLTYKMRQNSGF